MQGLKEDPKGGPDLGGGGGVVGGCFVSQVAYQARGYPGLYSYSIKPLGAFILPPG